MDPDLDPLAAWAHSGAMALTGRAAGSALGPPGGFVERLKAVEAAVLRGSARVGRPVEVDALALLGERAAIAGLRRGGERSCGGGTRLLPTSDGWLAVSLARPSDIELLPAWLHRDIHGNDPWREVAEAVGAVGTAALVAQGHLLGLPVAELPDRSASEAGAGDGAFAGLPVLASGLRTAAPSELSELMVVDLSSLWAGPLCAHLLGRAGARVIKVESTTRPDGARFGPGAFFDLLHAGHESVALDFTTPEGRTALRCLLEAADVVIEASRPRALHQLGIEAETLLRQARPRIWLSITGYGRTGDAAHKVAFGDDGAVAGGLVVWDDDGPCFCADAVADPATGIVATAAVLAALARGGRWLLDVSLQRVAAHFAGDSAGSRQPAIPAGPDGMAPTAAGPVPVAPPRARRLTGTAPPLGAHTDAVLAQLHRPRP